MKKEELVPLRSPPQQCLAQSVASNAGDLVGQCHCTDSITGYYRNWSSHQHSGEAFMSLLTRLYK